MSQHQKHFHRIQIYHLKYIDPIESCLMHQNHEKFRKFDHCMIACEEGAKVLQVILESFAFLVFEKCFLLLSDEHR